VEGCCTAPVGAKISAEKTFLVGFFRPGKDI
jgi:hypothetical protein